MGFPEPVMTCFFPAENEFCLVDGGSLCQPIPGGVEGLTALLDEGMKRLRASSYNETWHFTVGMQNMHLYLSGSLPRLVAGASEFPVIARYEIDLTASRPGKMAIVVKGISLDGVQGSVELPPCHLDDPILGTIGMTIKQYATVGGLIASIGNAPVPPVGYGMFIGQESRQYRNPSPNKVIAIRIAFGNRTSFVQIIDGTDPDPQKHLIFVDMDPANPRFVAYGRSP